MTGHESLFYNAAKETMIEYFQKTSLNGFGLLYYIRRRKYQRLLWFMFILMGIGFAIFVVSFTLYSFLADPTVTSLQSQYHKIWHTPFPAVAICSANKLSRRRVREYLVQFSKKDNFTNASVEDLKLMHKIKMLTGYYMPSLVDFEEALTFQNELDKKESKDGFNVPAVLKRLSPNCEELLTACRWSNNAYDCATLFQLHATVNGFCCIFNYQRSASMESAAAVFYPNGTGTATGLEVILNASKIDYLYTPRSFTGFMLQIFDTNVFPDASNGGIRELLVGANTDVQVELSLFTQVTTADARNYGVDKRQCYFADEYLQEYRLGYSQAECLTRCKLDSIQSLCGCIPFYAPFDFIDWSFSNVSYCTLTDAQCLDRYEIKWSSFKPIDNKPSNNYRKEDMQEALFCPHCLPLCTYNRYEHRKHVTNFKKLKHDTNLKFQTNCSRVNIFFPHQYALKYEKNVVYNWYQILSNIGGVIGISMGCSFISGFEVIYFLGYRLLENFYKLRKTVSS